MHPTRTKSRAVPDMLQPSLLPLHTRSRSKTIPKAKLGGLLMANRKYYNPDGSRMTCNVEGCKDPVKVLYMCSAHYTQDYRYNAFVKHSTAGPSKPCPTPGCERVLYKRLTLCAKCNRDRWRYNLTVEKWCEMNLPENKFCSNPGCNSTESLHIDHDHACSCETLARKTKDRVSCGECVRGWLCRSCNLGLGLFDDNIEKLEGIIQYLENWKTPRS